MKEFEKSSKLRIRNRGVRSQFEAWNRKWRSSIQILMLGIGNGGVRAQFEAEMEELEQSSRLGIGNGRVRAKFRQLESEMEEFEFSSDAWNRQWKSSS